MAELLRNFLRERQCYAIASLTKTLCSPN